MTDTQQLIEEAVQKIPKEWRVQYGTGDLPQSILSEPLIRCTQEELVDFLRDQFTAVASKSVEEEKKRLVSRKKYYCEKCKKYQEGKIAHYEGSQRESSISCEVCDSCIFIYQTKIEALSKKEQS